MCPACCACELDVDVLQNMGGLEDSPSYWQLHYKKNT